MKAFVLTAAILAHVVSALNSGGRGGVSRADNDAYDDNKASNAILWVLICLVTAFFGCAILSYCIKKKQDEVDD